MIVVDASCLAEVLLHGPAAAAVRDRLARDTDQAAPHAVDVEVFGVIRRLRQAGSIDETAAVLAVENLRLWPGERVGHRPLLDRAWQLRETIRGWDAMYVALAEALDATLVTLDARLARAPGPACPIELLA
jgi:predicted nucleic acid-binding protein